MIYQLLPVCYKHFKDQSSSPVVFILSPLVALISNHVSSSKELPSFLGINAVSLDVKHFKDIVDRKYNLIFGTPESFLNVKKWRDMMHRDFFVNNTICIVVDKVHKVKWGESSNPF